MQRPGSETLFKTDLEQSKKAIKLNIRKHFKLKEGTENLKKVATDKKTKAQCNAFIKEDNAKLQDLHDELQDLNARVSEGVTYVNDDALSPHKTDGVPNGSGSSRREYLETQIAVEMKVKQGAENMLAVYSGSKKKEEAAKAKQLLEDSRKKIDIFRMELLLERRQGMPMGKEDGVLMGSSRGKENGAPGSGLSPLKLRVQDVRHHIEIESRVMQGAEMMMKSLSESDQDKGLVEAERRFHESRQKLDLLYCSHSRHIGELNPEQAALGIYKEDNTLPSYRKSVALTGELDVCITGADRLLVVVPNRDPRKLSLAMVSPDGKIGECAGSNKKSSLSEVCVVLRLDNNVVGKTSWKAPGTECWKEQFRIKLDKSRELEVEVYWRDHRSLCGVAFLRLEELLDNQRRQIQVPLEPQGCLFAEVTFLNPTVTKKRRPQRKKRAFHFHKDAEKKFPRAGQKNTTFNVATRDRLQKTTDLPDCTTNNSTLSPHSTSSPFPRERAKIFVQQAPLVDCGEVTEDLEYSLTDNLPRGQQELRYTSVTEEKPIHCEKENTPPNNRKTKNQMIQENWNKDDCSTAASRSSFSDSYNHSSIDQPRALYMRRNSKRKKSPCGPIDSLSGREIPQIDGKRYTQGPHGEVEDKVNQEEPIIVNSPYSCIGSHQTMPTVERPGVPVDMAADHSNASDSYLHSFADSEKYMPEAGKPIEFAQENHVCASDGLNHFTEEDEANRSNRDETEDLRGKSNFVRIHERSNTIPSTSSENVCSKCGHLQENGNSPPTPTETRIHLMKGVTVLSKCWDILYSILRCIFLCLVLLLGFLLYRIWCASCWSVRNVVHYAALDRPFAVLRRRTSSLFQWIKRFRRSEKKDSTQWQTYNGPQDRPLAQLPSDVVESLMSDSCHPEEIVRKLKESLHLDEKCLEQPNPETKRTIRCLAKRAKDSKRIDVVEYLRKITPAGTTGPLLPGNLDICNIPVRQMRELTFYLSGGEEWKDVAKNLGLTPTEIRFFDMRARNCFNEALAFISQERRINVDDLYDELTDCGYPILADIL